VILAAVEEQSGLAQKRKINGKRKTTLGE